MWPQCGPAAMKAQCVTATHPLRERRLIAPAARETSDFRTSDEQICRETASAAAILLPEWSTYVPATSSSLVALNSLQDRFPRIDGNQLNWARLNEQLSWPSDRVGTGYFAGHPVEGNSPGFGS